MNEVSGADEAGLERPLAQLRSVLIPGETVEAWAIQSRLFALLHRRLLIAATSGRLIVLTRKTTDLASLGAAASQRVEFRGLRRSEAQAVYRICQSQDQAWREKRRVRDLEELRARSGGIQVSPGTLAVGTAAESDAVRRLQEAKQLLDARLISDAEYEAIKAKIISS